MSIFRTQAFANFIGALARLRYKLMLGYSVFNKIFLLGLFLFFLAWYNFDNIASLLITEKSVKDKFINAFTNSLNKPTNINGEVKFVTKPEPYVTIKDIEITASNNSYHNNFAEIGEISTKPNLLSLLIGKISYEEINLKNVKLYIHADKSKNQNLYDGLKEIATSKGIFNNKKINFRDLEIIFIKDSPVANSQKHIVRNVRFSELSIVPARKEFIIKGLLHSEKFGEDYIFSINFRDGITEKSDLSARLYSNDTELSFLGEADISNGFLLNGSLAGKISAFSFKFFSTLGLSNDILDAIQINETAEIKGDISINKKEILFKNFSAKSDVIELSFENKTDISEKFNSNAKINIINLDWRKLFKSRQEQISIRKIDSFEKDFNKRLEKFFLFSIGDDFNFSLDFNINKIQFFSEEIGNLSSQISYIDNHFLVNNFLLNLPGETQLKFLSDIKVNKQDKTMLGKLGFAIYGKNLSNLALATGVIKDQKNSPQLGEFFLQTSGNLDGRKIHFREIISKINDNKFAGQMLIDYNNSLQALSAFNFDRLELDKYIIKKNEKNYQSSFSEKVDFLRFLDSVFDEFKIAVKSSNLTKSGENLRDFELIANIKPGVTELKKLYFKSFKVGEVIAFGNIDIKDFQPIIDASIRIQRLDYDYIKYGSINASNDFYNFKGDWKDEQISFADLGYIQGKVKLAIDKLKYEHFNLDNFRLLLDMKGSKVDILDSKFELFNSQFTFSGWLTTEYPSFAISFVTTNLDSSSFLRNILGISQIYGKFNVSATIASTGYTLKQLIKDAKGRAEISTNGFKVTGFDLSGLSSGLVAAKKIEDTREIGLDYLSKGETIFSALKTSIGLSEGKILFNNIPISQYNSNNKGNINGSLNLSDWQNDLSSNFDVQTLDGINLALVAKTNGKIGNAIINWNEEIFPKYWEERFFGR